ncbi:unnamed protein product [Gulo gulo]|uniref:Uncharacterized protein n=1 Tax=Gulo gulo TaxID=48420 RepID=A0A9X9Q144_GULGU|nr:unnamed protein product [Gulo gulo]
MSRGPSSPRSSWACVGSQPLKAFARRGGPDPLIRLTFLSQPLSSATLGRTPPGTGCLRRALTAQRLFQLRFAGPASAQSEKLSAVGPNSKPGFT